MPASDTPFFRLQRLHARAARLAVEVAAQQVVVDTFIAKEAEASAARKRGRPDDADVPARAVAAPLTSPRWRHVLGVSTGPAPGAAASAAGSAAGMGAAAAGAVDGAWSNTLAAAAEGISLLPICASCAWRLPRMVRGGRLVTGPSDIAPGQIGLYNRVRTNEGGHIATITDMISATFIPRAYDIYIEGVRYWMKPGTAIVFANACDRPRSWVPMTAVIGLSPDRQDIWVYAGAVAIPALTELLIVYGLTRPHEWAGLEGRRALAPIHMREPWVPPGGYAAVEDWDAAERLGHTVTGTSARASFAAAMAGVRGGRRRRTAAEVQRTEAAAGVLRDAADFPATDSAQVVPTTAALTVPAAAALCAEDVASRSSSSHGPAGPAGAIDVISSSASSSE
jgi:hypothetical protein